MERIAQVVVTERRPPVPLPLLLEPAPLLFGIRGVGVGNAPVRVGIGQGVHGTVSAGTAVPIPQGDGTRSVTEQNSAGGWGSAAVVGDQLPDVEGVAHVRVQGPPFPRTQHRIRIEVGRKARGRTERRDFRAVVPSRHQPRHRNRRRRLVPEQPDRRGTRDQLLPRDLRQLPVVRTDPSPLVSQSSHVSALDAHLQVPPQSLDSDGIVLVFSIARTVAVFEGDAGFGITEGPGGTTRAGFARGGGTSKREARIGGVVGGGEGCDERGGREA
mmetsp:Transcript_27393/g.56068  ORF Transcript_27393/g.56068 Transcript_27393/m.56068 type:complete len:271 (+) Transcript_27393:664-1476(+)